MTNITGSDSVYFTVDDNGEILVDPVYASKNAVWFGLMKAASEANQIALIGKTPYCMVTAEQEAMWRNHTLTKIAMERDGTHMLEIVARWLTQFADRMKAGETDD